MPGLGSAVVPQEVEMMAPVWPVFADTCASASFTMFVYVWFSSATRALAVLASAVFRDCFREDPRRGCRCWG